MLIASSRSRSKTKPVNWELLFCQGKHPQERLGSVMIFKVSNQITEAAKMTTKLDFVWQVLQILLLQKLNTVWHA